MHQKDQDLSNALLQVLDGLHGSGDLYTFDEGLHGLWPAGVLDGLFGAKLIIPSPKDFYGKHWCEYCCTFHMETITQYTDGRGWRYKLFRCKNPKARRRNNLPLDVSPSEVKEWETSPHQLRNAVAAALGVLGKTSAAGGATLHVGLVKGKDGRTFHPLTLHRLALHYNDATAPLAECLVFNNGRLQIFLPGEGEAAKPSAKTRLRILAAEDNYERWCAEAHRLRERNPNLSDSDVARRIAATPLADGKTEGTIRKALGKCPQ